MENTPSTAPEQKAPTHISAFLTESMLLLRNMTLGFVIGSGFAIMIFALILVMEYTTTGETITSMLEQVLEHLTPGYQITKEDALSFRELIESIKVAILMVAQAGIAGAFIGIIARVVQHKQLIKRSNVLEIFLGALTVGCFVGFWELWGFVDGWFIGYSLLSGKGIAWSILLSSVVAAPFVALAVKQKNKPYLLLGAIPLAIGVFVIFSNRGTLLEANLWQPALIILLATGAWSGVCIGLGRKYGAQMTIQTGSKTFDTFQLALIVIVASSVGVAAYSIHLSDKFVRNLAHNKAEFEVESPQLVWERYVQFRNDMEGRSLSDVKGKCLDISNSEYRNLLLAYDYCFRGLDKYYNESVSDTSSFKSLLNSALDYLDDATLRLLGYNLSKMHWFQVGADKETVQCLNALSRQYSTYLSGTAFFEKQSRFIDEPSVLLQYYSFVAPGFQMPESCNRITS